MRQGTRVSSQISTQDSEIPHKSRSTLMSPQECEVSQCYQNQLQIKPNSPVLAQEVFPVPYHTRQSGLTSFRQLAKFPETHVFSLQEHQFQQWNSSKAPCTPIVSRRELIPRILLNSKTNFKQAPQEEPSLSNKYVRGTLILLHQVEWIPRFPDQK